MKLHMTKERTNEIKRQPTTPRPEGNGCCEQLVVLRKETHQRFTQVDERFDKVDQKIADFREETNQRFADIDKQLGVINERFNTLDERMKASVAEVKTIATEAKASVAEVKTIAAEMRASAEEAEKRSNKWLFGIALSVITINTAITGTIVSIVAGVI